MQRIIYLLVLITALFAAACKKEDKDLARPLSVTGMLPASGNAGTVVTIRGTGFSRNINDNEVSFNGTKAHISSANDTMLIVASPADGTSGPVTVKVNGHTANGDVYTYQALSIHAISPDNGPAGTNIYIKGAGFVSIDSLPVVTINGQKAIISNANDTLLVVVVPADAGAGPVAISVNGQHATGPAFTYQAITGIKPATGGAGTVVTIQGQGFSANAGDNHVAFNGVAATVTSASATQLVVTVPQQVTTGPVSLTINDQRTTGPAFTVVPAPVISAVAPLSGPVGTMVTITGQNFSSLTDEDQVTINGTVVNMLSATNKQLTLTIPAGTTSGAIKVLVNGQAVSGPDFTVQALGISALTPDNGLDGTVVTMKGIGFNTDPASNIVTINGLSVTVTAATDTTLTVTMPAGVTTGQMIVKVGSLTAATPVFRRAGVITIYKGSLIQNSPSSMVVDSKGYIYFAENSMITRVAPDGTAAVYAGSSTPDHADGVGTAAAFRAISGMTIDGNDNIYISDSWDNTIRKMTSDGTVSTLISGLPVSPKFITMDPQGHICFTTEYSGFYMLTAGNTAYQTIRNNGGASAPIVLLNGIIYYGMPDPSVVYSLNVNTNTFQPFAGTWYQNGYVDGPVGTGKLDGPGSLVYDPVANLIYVVEGSNYSIRAVSPQDGSITTITGAGGTYQPWQSGYKDGTLGEALFRNTSSSPIAVDRSGNIYLMDTYNKAIRKVVLK